MSMAAKFINPNGLKIQMKPNYYVYTHIVATIKYLEMEINLKHIFNGTKCEREADIDRESKRARD